jgi:hypothetical protein
MQVRAFLAGLALVAAGCGRAPVPAPVPEPIPGAPPVDTREISLDAGFITIRVDIPREPPGPKPAVLTMIGERPRMLRAGLVTISYQVHWEQLEPLRRALPPAPAPERTWGKWLLTSPSPKTVGKGYFDAITGDATGVIPRVLDAVAGMSGIDMTRLGIVGTSTTGFKALQAIAHDPRFTAAVVVAACGDYHRFLYGSSLGMGGTFLDLGADYEAQLHAIEPVRHPERFTRTALLLLSGADDPVIPARCVEVTAQTFARAYAEAGVPERFRSAVVPGLGHAFVPALRRDMMGWWRRWLLTRPR